MVIVDAVGLRDFLRETEKGAGGEEQEKGKRLHHNSIGGFFHFGQGEDMAYGYLWHEYPICHLRY